MIVMSSAREAGKKEKPTACLPAAAGLRRQAPKPCRGYQLKNGDKARAGNCIEGM
jgi:hypothetical protein